MQKKGIVITAGSLFMSLCLVAQAAAEMGKTKSKEEQGSFTPAKRLEQVGKGGTENAVKPEDRGLQGIPGLKNLVPAKKELQPVPVVETPAPDPEGQPRLLPDPVKKGVKPASGQPPVDQPVTNETLAKTTVAEKPAEQRPEGKFQEIIEKYKVEAEKLHTAFKTELDKAKAAGDKAAAKAVVEKFRVDAEKLHAAFKAELDKAKAELGKERPAKTEADRVKPEIPEAVKAVIEQYRAEGQKLFDEFKAELMKAKESGDRPAIKAVVEKYGALGRQLIADFRADLEAARQQQ